MGINQRVITKKLVEKGSGMNAEGNTAGFHYGTFDAPCAGVLHLGINETHEDGRQLCLCDACGSKCVMRPMSAERIAADQKYWSDYWRKENEESKRRAARIVAHWNGKED